MATQALGKTRKPSIAEINDAKKKEAEKKAAADRAKAKLNAASNQLKILTAKAVAARNRYLQEVKKLQIATKKAEAAKKKEDIAIAKSNKAQNAVVEYNQDNLIVTHKYKYGSSSKKTRL